MVAYRLDGIPNTMPSVAPPPRSEPSIGTQTWLADSRRTAESYQQPVAVFDSSGQPVFQNKALAQRLTPDAASLSPDSWPLVYSTACRIVAEALAGRSAISTVIPVNLRSFAILGSLLRQESGSILGAIVHISEVNTPSVRSDAALSRPANNEDAADDAAYQTWMTRRNEAQARMQRLSPRESEVVSRVSLGMPNKSIARELEISVKTIEKHRANAVRKLGVTSTPEMVRIAVLAEKPPATPDYA